MLKIFIYLAGAETTGNWKYQKNGGQYKPKHKILAFTKLAQEMLLVLNLKNIEASFHYFRFWIKNIYIYI